MSKAIRIIVESAAIGLLAGVTFFVGLISIYHRRGVL